MPNQNQTGSNDKLVRLVKLPGAGATTATRPGQKHEPNNTDNEESDGGIVLRGHTGTVRDICYPYAPPTTTTTAAIASATPADSAAAAVLPDRLLSVGTGDFACRIWDVRGGVTAAKGRGSDRDEEGGVEPLVVFTGHTDTVFSCSMLPGGNVRDFYFNLHVW